MARLTAIKIGDRYGIVTVLRKVGKLGYHPRRVIFECKCDCGTIKNFDAGNLKKPTFKSCGCIRRAQAKIKGKNQRTELSFFNLIYGNYVRSARFRKIGFFLSKDEFKKIILKNCYYCNSEPVLPKITNVGIPFSVNGVDRLDSDKDYTTDNCVSCCTMCNHMKSKHTVNEFLGKIKSIYQFRVKQSQNETPV